jgi:tetratricopeptide (TPR) repeat protein
LAARIPALLDGTSPAEAGSVYSLLAEVYADLGDVARAKELYEQAAELLEQSNPNPRLIDVYSQIAELYEAQGRREDAYEYMKKAVGMQQRVAAATRT